MGMAKSNFPIISNQSPQRVPPGSGFRVTILGRAGSFPAPGEPTTGLLLSTATTHVLIDCGSGVLVNLLKVLSPELLTGVIITHLHPDHVSDLTVLTHLVRHYIWVRDHGKDQDRKGASRPIPLYVPYQPTGRVLSLPMDEAFDRRFYGEDSRIGLGDIEFTFAETSHAVHCLALRATHGGASFVFTGDTGYSRHVVNLALGADLLAVELSAPDSQAGRAARVGHLTPHEAARLIIDSGAARALMTHFVMGYDADELVQKTCESVTAGCRSMGRVPPPVEAAQLLQTYPVSP